MSTQGAESPTLSPVVLITGEGDQGQNLVAMACVEAAIQNGQTILHNGCSKAGLRISKTALSQDEDLAELMRLIGEEAVFVLSDADCIPALRPYPEGTAPQWLRVCKEQRHMVVLTTVRGREHTLRDVIENEDTSHVQVEAGYSVDGVFLTWASGDLRERLPVGRQFTDHETVVQWTRLSDGSYQSPQRPEGELIRTIPRSTVTPTDYTDAVRSTETPMPKHPANSFLLTRVIRQDDNHRTKTTEMIGLGWLESVNKRRDEEVAIQTIEWACEKWGFVLGEVETNQETTYPDGTALTIAGKVNIEVTKVQPKWPSGATLAELTASIREGKAPNPDKEPVIQCRECGTLRLSHIRDIHIIPEHDETHAWTCTYPKAMVDPDHPENLTALPELPLGIEQLTKSIAEAVSKKNDRAQRYGKGQKNWLVLIIEGFPPISGADSLLLNFNWESLDAVFAVMSDEFGSAIHGFQPDDYKRITVLKCPEQDGHICYHPGLLTVTRKGDSNFDPLRGHGKDQGITHQITTSDGDVLAEFEEEPPQPRSFGDLLKGIQTAAKWLPYQAPNAFA